MLGYKSHWNSVLNVFSLFSLPLICSHITHSRGSQLKYNKQPQQEAQEARK